MWKIKDFRYKNLKLKVKNLIEKSKSMHIIKPYTIAFEDFPTKLEQPKGKLTA